MKRKPNPRPRFLLWSVGFILFFSGHHLIAQTADDYSDYSVPGLPGLLFVPPQASTSNQPLPLIVALHGSGGIGNGTVGYQVDFEPLLAAAAARGAFLYVPQATSAYWSRENRPQAIMAQVTKILARYPADPDRLYVTGLSMGGGGTWDMLSAYPNRFAAGIPICGINPDPPFFPTRLVDTPIWVFHARNDPSVPVSLSQNNIDQILRAAFQSPPSYLPSSSVTDFEYTSPTKTLKYTEWSTGGHNIWLRVYRDETAMDWMFAQSLGNPVEDPTDDPIDDPIDEPVISTRVTTHPQSATIAVGGNVSFSVAVEAAGAATIQWTKDDQPLPDANQPTLVLSNLGVTHAGRYRAVITTPAETLTTRVAVLQVADPAPGRLVNLSVRARVIAHDQPLITGFVAQSDEPRSVLLRVIGPALAAYGVVGPMPDPTMQIHHSEAGVDRILSANDNWEGTPELQATFAAVGAFPLTDDHSADAAAVVAVNGAVTVHAHSADDSLGTVLVELYDLDSGDASRLVNFSARHHVGDIDAPIIAGFAISGNIPKQLMIRGVGPGLAQFDVEDVLSDPRIEIHTSVNGVDTIVAMNDNWNDEATPAALSSLFPGAFSLPDGSRDAVVLTTLTPGVYTVILSSANHETGQALIEVYEAL